jgi:SAM-dependent methyltransferase
VLEFLNPKEITTKIDHEAIFLTQLLYGYALMSAKSTTDDALKRTIASYDAHASDYVARNQEAGFWLGKGLNFERLRPYLVSHAHLLDVGCGAGQDVANWRAEGVQAWGVDLSLGMLRQAQPHAGGLVVQADMRDLPFASASWDAIWMSASLLHISRQQASVVLREVARILREGGHVCLSVKMGAGERITHNLGERHFVYYQPDELESLVQGAGFAIVDRWQQAPSDVHREGWLGVVARR